MGVVLTCRVGVEWVNTFHGAQGELSTRDDNAGGFYNAMVAAGHTGVFNWGDDNAWETDFRDPAFGGDSTHWTDDVHFLYYSDHGGNFGDTYVIAFGSNHDNQLSWGNQWKLGSSKLRWATFDTCDLVLNLEWAHVWGTLSKMVTGLHLIMGFVGLAWDSTHDNYASNFGHDVGAGGRIGNAWLEHAWSSSVDDNPVVFAFGSTVDEAVNRRDNETLNWRDFNYSSIGAVAWAAWF